MGMFQNPMVMMMGVVGVMAVALPYMMVRDHFDGLSEFWKAVIDWTDMQKNLDPEQLKEVQENQARMVRMQSSITSGDIGRLAPLVLPFAPRPVGEHSFQNFEQHRIYVHGGFW